MKIEEVVKKYQEAYLEGKSETERQEFYKKDIKRQYGNIQAWRRRLRLKNMSETVDPAEIIMTLQCEVQHIKNLRDMSDKEMKKILREIENLRVVVEDFDRIRRENKLKALKKQQLELQRMISELEKE